MNKQLLSGFLLLTFLRYASAAGDWKSGATAGLSVALGNKIIRIGAFAAAWIAYADRIQYNPGIRLLYHFKNLGPPGKYMELNVSNGLLVGWGKRDADDNPFVNSVANHTGRRYSIAYACNIYRDGMQMNQKTGTVALQIRRLSIIAENDLLGDGKDRFRTGALAVQYRRFNNILGISIITWTGEKGKRVTESGYPSRRGYRETTRFGNCSHGIIALQVQHHAGYGQNIHAAAGVDAEQIRHLFQNRLTHDLCFLPAEWVKTPSSHVPMLDADENMYLFLPGQKIRKPSFYGNIAANPGLFY
ncbi:MAG: hypothetical protein LBS09_07610 [Bacteroidales bacterium]|nr:hypothetical protein [Bacteroidales bacterium]